MLVIRFQKIGKKNQKIMRLVLQEKRSKLQGKVIKVLGWYNPHTKKGEFKKEDILFYIKNGAQVSDTAFNILVKFGILPGPKRKVSIRIKRKSEEKGSE
jgi:small subunit ribosomal protein S16